jgi:hypothetical protein
MAAAVPEPSIEALMILSFAGIAKNADGIPYWRYFSSAIIIKAMLELMAKERGDSRRSEAERGHI